jgi:predicted HTH transcriptional regulator
MLKQESQHTEWKEIWRDDYLRWVCGFANAQGGRLLLGVNDKGQVVGLSGSAKLLKDLPNKVRDLLGRQGRTWDSVPMPQFSLADVSATSITRFRQLAQRSGRPYGETLLGSHSSSPYNPAIANAFFRAGEIEAWGRGVERIFAACAAAGTPKPVLRYEPYDMWMEFSFEPAYLKVLRAGRGQNEQAEAQVTPQVTPEVERMLKLVNGEMSRAELMSALGLKDEKHFRIHYQQTALALGMLEMTVPDKPQSRLQKYRLTQAGRSWLAVHVKT